MLFSIATKHAILIELTCPCEENMSDRHKTKVEKYTCLCEEIINNGWKLIFFAVEVGARGYCAKSLSWMLLR